MSETVKQAVGRCKGTIFVLLDGRYAPDGVLWPVSKPQARKIIDMSETKDRQPTPFWEGDNLTLLPNGV